MYCKEKRNMNNFTLFIQLICSEELNQDFGTILGKLLNRNIQSRILPLKLNEIIKILNDNNFGCFVEELIEEPNTSIVDYIQEQGIDDNINFQNFLTQLNSKNLSIRFTNTKTNFSRQFIMSAIIE